MSISREYFRAYCERTGDNMFNASREATKAAKPLELERALSLGYDSVEEYRDAIHEFLNCN